jgi:hypothetical protein
VLEERFWGVAGGQSSAEAIELAGIVESILPTYRSLEDYDPSPLRIHFTDKVDIDTADGITVERGYSHDWVSVSRSAENAPLVVAHELGHFYFQNYHARFPSVLEEGICELMASMCLGSDALGKQSLFLASLSYVDNIHPVIEAQKASYVSPACCWKFRRSRTS